MATEFFFDLREFFGGKTPSLQETRAAVLRIRAAKSMVIDASDPNSKSAGSFFKNPIVEKEKFAEVEKRAKLCGIESVPFFKADESGKQVPDVGSPDAMRRNTNK